MSPASSIIIRKPIASDAALLMDFGNQLLGETDYYVRAPGERANTPDDMLRIINWYNKTKRQSMFHAWDGNIPVGEVVVMAGQLARTSNCAQLGIGILKSHQSCGIGKALMLKAEEYAISHDVHRIEFTVLHHNKAAYSFYQKLGYSEEGRKSQSVFMSGKYYDEIMMGKILSPLPLQENQA